MKGDLTADEFISTFDLMGVQRHLKAAGIFARLHHRDGKSGYLNDIPRTLRYISETVPQYAELSFLSNLLENRDLAVDGNDRIMAAMILAAGLGERLRPITDTTPKALVEVGGISMLGQHLQRLANARVKTVVINLGWLGEQIAEQIGSGTSVSACRSSTVRRTTTSSTLAAASNGHYR